MLHELTLSQAVSAVDEHAATCLLSCSMWSALQCAVLGLPESLQGCILATTCSLLHAAARHRRVLPAAARGRAASLTASAPQCQAAIVCYRAHQVASFERGGPGCCPGRAGGCGVRDSGHVNNTAAAPDLPSAVPGGRP